MSLTKILRNVGIGIALVSSLSCGTEISCNEGRRYVEGQGCVDDSKDAGSVDSFVEKDTYTPPKDTFIHPIDTYIPKEDTFVEEDTYMPPKDTYVCPKMEVFKDVDGDGYGSKFSKMLCEPEGNYTATNPKDCDDNNKEIHPNAKEECNNKDDNCNGKTDEDLSQSCKNECNTGLEYCIQGEWKNCNASKNCSTDILGDTNCDGKVDITDVNQIKNYNDGKITSFKTKNGNECISGLKNADTDCNGKIDVFDMTTIVDFVNGYSKVVECPKDELVMGDVNCDGKVDISDHGSIVSYVLKEKSGFNKPGGSNCTTGKKAADINCDGKIDMEDTKIILANILQEIPFLGICKNGWAIYDDFEDGYKNKTLWKVDSNYSGDGIFAIVESNGYKQAAYLGPDKADTFLANPIESKLLDLTKLSEVQINFDIDIYPTKCIKSGSANIYLIDGDKVKHEIYKTGLKEKIELTLKNEGKTISIHSGSKVTSIFNQFKEPLNVGFVGKMKSTCEGWFDLKVKEVKYKY